MTAVRRVAVVGASHAGFTLAASLRDAGYDGSVVLVDADPELPYQRPPLSKAYLAGAEDSVLPFRSQVFFADKAIELVLGDRVVEIDRSRGRLVLESGAAVGYDHLVLATGARERILPIPGANLDGVLALRTRDHAEQMRERLSSAQSVVVVGGGFIGLEVASAAVDLGVETTVVEMMPRVMQRAVSEAVSGFFTGAHVRRHVSVHCGAGIARILGECDRVVGVETDAGMVLPADLVVAGTGVVPNVELAARAGLATGNGIVVDARLRTTDGRISAIGDCALFPRRGDMIRLESVQNATDQARCVAAQLTGRDQAYRAVPWFWSDQAKAKLQIAGLTAGADQVVTRGDPGAGQFTAFAFSGGSLLGAESVNRTGDHMAVRRIMSAGRTVTPEQAADDSFDLKEYARSESGSAAS